MTAVLVTGAQGFIGRYLCGTIRQEQPTGRIIGIGRSAPLPGYFTHSLAATRPGRAPLPSNLTALLRDRFTYERVDVCDLVTVSSVLERHRPQLVFHLAGALRHARPEHIARTNVPGTASLLKAIAAMRGEHPRVVVCSSGAVYGSLTPEQLPAHESTRCAPVDDYGLSKLCAEQIAAKLAQQHSVDIVIARIFNVCGPGQDEDHACGHFAAQIASRRQELHVRSLTATRDFIDVRDVARALLVLAKNGTPGLAYNVGGGGEVAVSVVLEQMLQQSGYSGQVVSDSSPDEEPDVSRHFGDTGRLHGLGFSPRHALAESLRDLLSYQIALAKTSRGA